MDVFKRMIPMDDDDHHHHDDGQDDRAAARRRVVSQDGASDAMPVREEVPEPSSCCHYINDDISTHSNFFPNNPYGRRPTKPLLAPLVTTTRFDDDETFVGVAQDMIIKFEHHSMTEREAIQSTLRTVEERRAFLEALDFKNANLNLQDDDATGVEDVVITTRSIFGSTLQTMWKESMVEKAAAAATPTTVASETSFFAEAGMVEDGENVDMYYSIHHPPKTPKNIAMSPVECTFGSSKVSTGIILSPVDYNNDSQNHHQKQSKKRRRWFFAETSTGVDPEGATRTDRVTSTRPNRSKKRYSFDFKLRSSAWEQPNSSSVGGLSFSTSQSMMPVATSPILRVSIDPEQY
mmetsp:Transcript_42058/g.101132  ORF Transcript_42058/g.101132 Transcript_42058/m.101132 type:complete len:349 (+) Transcript_42058:250-1296(+)